MSIDLGRSCYMPPSPMRSAGCGRRLAAPATACDEAHAQSPRSRVASCQGWLKCGGELSQRGECNPLIQGHVLFTGPFSKCPLILHGAATHPNLRRGLSRRLDVMLPWWYCRSPVGVGQLVGCASNFVTPCRCWMPGTPTIWRGLLS